ncbi:DMT family transporter [Gordonia sp. CPCC 206044]|uniref:DMT family transporter n=1 Tax=Gordonia sp. CPCC 206044 TaxID=3140793 RepID=UPI003AF3CF41
MMTSPIGIPERWVTGILGGLFVVSWSSGFIGAKLGGDVPVPTTLMWRFVPIAAVLALVVWIRARRGPRMTVGPREWRRQILIGALSQGGYLATVYWAIDLGVSTGTTALIDGVQPLVVAALAGPILGLATTGRQWIGVGVGAAGVVIVTWTDAMAAGGQTRWWGYLVPLLGMACLVAATFLEKGGRRTLSSLQTLTVHCATSAVLFTLVCVATGTVTPPAQLGFWAAIAWLIVFSTLGGYGLYWVLLHRLGVTSVNSLMFLMPPVTAVWGSAMFGEPFTWTTALGLALALGATWVVSRDSSGPSDTPRPRTRTVRRADDDAPTVATCSQ